MNVGTPTQITPWLFPRFLLLVFCVMAVWPLLGVAASFSILEKMSEAVLLFGGLTVLFLLPVNMLVPFNESGFVTAIIIVWLLIWAGCTLWFTSGSSTRGLQLAALVVVSSISLCQSVLGFLMLLGKYV